MKYYITADGGGTKLLVILYDENFHILRSVRTAGTNSCFKPVEQITRETEELADKLFSEDITAQVSEIASLDLSIVGDRDILIRALSRHVTIKECHSWGEGAIALGAAGVTHGCVAQAGTGSDAFLIQPDYNDTVGGWGALLGDEGSGYDIGLRTLKAAIYAKDGRGPATRILPILCDCWKMKNLWDLVGRTVNNPDARRLVASASYITELAADEGDETALAIFAHAGYELASQVNTVLSRHPGTIVGPVVTSGGAWKGSGRMFEAFSGEVLALHPELSIMYPIFEPVVGCVILRLLSEGKDFADVEPVLRTEFSDFLYRHK